MTTVVFNTIFSEMENKQKGIIRKQLYINFFLALILIAEAFGFTGFAMLITRVATEASSASIAANLVTFPMMFLSGSFFPVESMPDFLKVVASILPLYYVNEGLREAMIFNDLDAAIIYFGDLRFRYHSIFSRCLPHHLETGLKSLILSDLR